MKPFCEFRSNDFTEKMIYYESIKQELKRRPIYECRCDERLKAKAEESTRLAYTRLRGGLEHLKIETRLINERFASVMGECDLEAMGAPAIFNVIHSVEALARMLPTLDLRCEENTERW
jgi:hypothetical protein